LVDDEGHHIFHIPQNLSGGNPDRLETLRQNPRVTNVISFWPATPAMGFPIHFNRQPRPYACKVEHIVAKWMLFAKLIAAGPFFQLHP
jgi:hypothetical protein